MRHQSRLLFVRSRTYTAFASTPRGSSMLSQQDVIPLPVATVVYPQQHPLAGQTGVVNAYAVCHSTGLILVDTGVGEGSPIIDALYQPVRQTLTAALGAHGFVVKDVIALVNTHLHFDHCGQNRRFSGVPIYVQAVEYRAAQQPKFTIAAWVTFPGAVYHQLNGETELAAGVSVVPTPGHTPGHQSLVLETDAGRVLLAGQAVQSRADYACLHDTGELPAASAGPDDEAAYRASAQRLLSYAARRVYFSHDEAVWEG